MKLILNLTWSENNFYVKIRRVIQAVGGGGVGKRGVGFTGRIELGVICVPVKTNTKFMEKIAEWEEEDDEEEGAWDTALGHT